MRINTNTKQLVLSERFNLFSVNFKRRENWDSGKKNALVFFSERSIKA